MSAPTTSTSAGWKSDPARRARRTLESYRLAATQQHQALVIYLLPTAGVIASLLWTLRGHPVGRFGLGCLVAMYAVTALAMTVGDHRHFMHGSFHIAARARKACTLR